MANNNVLLVTGSYDHSLIFWQADTGQPTQTIEYSEKQIINRIDISLDKKYLGVAGSNTAAYYDLPSQKTTPLHIYDGYSNNVTGIGIQKESVFMYTCSEDGSVKTHDMRTNTCPHNFNNKDPINCIVLHPNEAELIVGDQQGNIRVFDLVKDTCSLKLTPCPDVGIRSLTINGSYLIAADSAGNFHVYLLQNWNISEDKDHYYKIEAHQDYILKILLSPDNKYLASCSADKTVKLWSNKPNEKYGQKWEIDRILYGHSKWVWDCAFSCDSEYLITASSDCIAKIWQTETGDLLRNLKQHKQAINCLALNDIGE